MHPSAARRGFSRSGTELRWTGPLDPDVPDAPRVTLRFDLTRSGVPELAEALDEGDPRAGDRAVRATPMPLGMLDALARVCVERDRDGSRALAQGAHGPDPRWSRALARALTSAGEADRPARPSKCPVIYTPPEGLSIRALRALPDDRLAILSSDRTYASDPVRYALAIGPDARPARTLRFTVPKERALHLPQVSLGDPARVWLTEQDHTTRETLVREYDADGELASTRVTTAASPVQRVLVAHGRLWLFGEREVLRVGDTREPALALPRFEGAREPWIVGDWLAVLSPTELDPGRRVRVCRTLTWVNLATGTALPPVPFDQPVHAALCVSGWLLCATDAGVLAFSPEAAPRTLFAGQAFGLSTDGDTVAFACQRAVIALDARTLAERRRYTAEHECYGTHCSPAGIAAWSFQRATFFTRDGGVAYASDERREPRAFSLADGSVVLSAGEQVVAITPEGAVRATASLPYDGQLVATTADRAIFGPVSGGIPRTRPTGLYAIDARGVVTDHVLFDEALPERRPERTRYGGGSESDPGLVLEDRVLLVDARGALRRWTLRDEPVQAPLATWTRCPTERDARVIRGQTYNPRDDWPRAGVELASVIFTAIDGTYRGTTGVMPERAVLAREGTVATFVRCSLDQPGAGGAVSQHSTVVLYDCAAQAGDFAVEPGSHLLVLDPGCLAPAEDGSQSASAVPSNGPRSRGGSRRRAR